MEVIAHHLKQQEVMRHLYLELGKTKTKKNSLNLWIVSDNLLRGAALNSVEIAETVINSK